MSDDLEALFARCGATQRYRSAAKTLVYSALRSRRALAAVRSGCPPAEFEDQFGAGGAPGGFLRGGGGAATGAAASQHARRGGATHATGLRGAASASWLYPDSVFLGACSAAR